MGTVWHSMCPQTAVGLCQPSPFPDHPISSLWAVESKWKYQSSDSSGWLLHLPSLINKQGEWVNPLHSNCSPVAAGFTSRHQEHLCTLSYVQILLRRKWPKTRATSSKGCQINHLQMSGYSTTHCNIRSIEAIHGLKRREKNKILGKSQTQTTWVSLHSCFFCDFSRTVQNSHCGLAPKGCCCHRENEDEDLSFTRTMIWCVTSQTASKPLYQQLQKAARTLGYNLTVLITEDQSKVEISAAVYHLGWHQTWGSMEDQHQPGLGHYFGLAVW